MQDKINTTNNKFECAECRNEVTCDPDKNVSDVVECPFCGIEYEISAKDGDNVTLQIIEEEK